MSARPSRPHWLRTGWIPSRSGLILMVQAHCKRVRATSARPADDRICRRGLIPAGTVGVTVGSNVTFKPYMMGIAGINTLKASSEATARGGYALTPPSGSMFPAGISKAFFETYPFCTGAVGSGPDSKSSTSRRAT